MNNTLGTQATPEEDMLSRFGYTGPMGLNPYEQKGLSFIDQMTAGGGPLQTMMPAQGYLGDVLSGAYSPTGAKFSTDVYEATKAGAMQTLAEQQKAMANRFANYGGYFGGPHALAQSKLAERTGTSLSGILANLNLSGFNQDQLNRLAAAGQSTTMAGQQQNIVSDMLKNIMGGGQLVTGREALNRAEYQAATQRAYEDWVRAQQEQQLPFQYALSLLGMQPFENFAQQPQQSPWGQLLGSVIGAGGQLGSAAIMASDEKVKEAVEPIKNGMGLINQLKPVSFRYRKDYQNRHKELEDKEHYGFIAQDFQKVFPTFVKKIKERYVVREENPGEETIYEEDVLYMDPYPVVAHLVAAVQELDSRVKELEAK